ncbi:MAG: class I SAM-dependent methyltransferase [Alphaproteobacteria bacterium]
MATSARSSAATPQFNYISGELEAMANIPNYQNWIMERFAPYLKGQVLEIGAGIGTYSKRLAAHPSVTHLDCLEPDAGQTQTIQALKLPHTEAFAQLSETFFQQKKIKNTYDAVVMINVLEHIEDDLACAQSIYNALKPGGYFLVFVPALQPLFSELDHLLGHYRRYHLNPMKTLLETAGFTITDARYMDTLGIAPWYVVNKLGKSTKMSPKAVKLYDTVGVPFTKFAESFMAPPVGKNVIAIAQKPLACVPLQA